MRKRTQSYQSSHFVAANAFSDPQFFGLVKDKVIQLFYAGLKTELGDPSNGKQVKMLGEYQQFEI